MSTRSSVGSSEFEIVGDRSGWFWATALVLFLLIAASAAPAPLYRVYQQQWGFSDSTLTAVFAVYRCCRPCS
jgi:hypothetical protein